MYANVGQPPGKDRHHFRPHKSGPRLFEHHFGVPPPLVVALMRFPGNSATATNLEKMFQSHQPSGHIAKEYLSIFQQQKKICHEQKTVYDEMMKKNVFRISSKGFFLH